MITLRIFTICILSTIILAQDDIDFGSGDYTETGENDQDLPPTTTTTSSSTTQMSTIRTTSTTTTSTRPPITTTRRTTIVTFRPQPSLRFQMTTTPDYDYDQGPGFATDAPEEETTTRRTPTTRRTNRPDDDGFQPTQSPDEASPTRRYDYNPTTNKFYNVDWQEDNVWNRIGNFIRQLYNESNNIVSDNIVDYILDRLGDFVNIFRYQGYDNHHHFHHCTQLLGGCKFLIKPNLAPTTEGTIFYDYDDQNNPIEAPIGKVRQQPTRNRRPTRKRLGIQFKSFHSITTPRPTKVFLSANF